MPRSGPNAIVCTLCGKTFGRKPDLRRHAAIHDPNAERFYCAYPGCNHSSLQKSNLKTHYIARHMRKRPYKCRFDGCGNSYGDGSALIKHEKRVHGFFRKGEKQKEQSSSSLIKDLNLKIEAPSPSSSGYFDLPSLSYSSSIAPSPAPSTSFSTSSVPLSLPDVATSHIQESFVRSQTTGGFLHEMVPEFFPDPSLKFMQNFAQGIPLNTDFSRAFEQTFLPYNDGNSYFPQQATQFPTFAPSFPVPAFPAANTWVDCGHFP